MAKALIVFGSTTGNTATVARQIGHIFTQEGIDVRIQDVRTTKTEEVGRSFDITLLGASSRGNIDTIAFQEDFAPFYEDIRKADIKNKKVALFGCGDSTREYFCGAVDLLQEKIGDLGGIVVNEPLRVDGDPQAALATIIQWALDAGQRNLPGVDAANTGRLTPRKATVAACSRDGFRSSRNHTYKRPVAVNTQGNHQSDSRQNKHYPNGKTSFGRRFA